MIYQHAAADRDRRKPRASTPWPRRPACAYGNPPATRTRRLRPTTGLAGDPSQASGGTYKAVEQTPCILPPVASTGDLRVSSRGQMSLPAAARTRWELGDGGDVAYLDLGDALLLVPGGVGALRRQVIDAVTEADWQAAASGFGDPDLADG